jgi:hypothetical protein
MHLSNLGIGLKILFSFSVLEQLNSPRACLVNFISIVRNLKFRVVFSCFLLSDWNNAYFVIALSVSDLNLDTQRQTNITIRESVFAHDVKSDVCLSFACSLINFDNKEGKRNPFLKFLINIDSSISYT